MTNFSRREFLAATSASLATALVHKTRAAEQAAKDERVAFFLVGDTHYLANKERPAEIDEKSQAVNAGLINWLNKLPGQTVPDVAGGGTVAAPRGLIHAGDLIDTGDKNGIVQLTMQQTEWAAFEADYGVSGKEGRLKFPVYEVHGNHDSPGGDGLAVDGIRARNKKRPGLVNLSANGLHYSWDWGPVHFINLGIVVGAVPEVTRKRRYAPLDSLPFLKQDLAEHAKDRERPIVITHHVDMARYAAPLDALALPANPEWDSADVQGYFEAIRGHNVVAVLYGHTHARNIFRWDGTKSTKAASGVPVFNTDNAGHFNSLAQAFFYFEITAKELIAREFATTDAWKTGNWTPQVWRVPVSKA